VVIGVSPDPLAALRKFRAKHSLPFVLLSDPEHQVAEMYGVWREKKMFGKTYFGIVRSHFVLDDEGRIMDAQIKISPAKSVQKAVETLLGTD